MKKLYMIYGIIAVLIFISGYITFLIPLTKLVILTIILEVIAKSFAKKSNRPTEEGNHTGESTAKATNTEADYLRWKSEHQK